MHAVTGTAVRRLETTLLKPVQGIVPAPGHGYNTTQHEHSYEPHTVCKKACALRGNAHVQTTTVHNYVQYKQMGGLRPAVGRPEYLHTHIMPARIRSSTLHTRRAIKQSQAM